MHLLVPLQEQLDAGDREQRSENVDGPVKALQERHGVALSGVPRRDRVRPVCLGALDQLLA